MIYKAIDYWNFSPDSYLEHHGVKGMKWGVRKDRIKKIGSKVKTIASGIKTGAEKRLWKRGKKLSKNYYSPTLGSISGLTSASIDFRVARGLSYAAKNRYMYEKMSGIYQKPSTLTVGTAAASVALTALGGLAVGTTLYNNAAYKYYSNNKGKFK